MIWATIAGMALVTYLLRASFLLLPASVETPHLLKRALRFVPAAILTAIWAPELAFDAGALRLSPDNVKLLAGAIAIAAAWRWRTTSVTIASGLVALHVFDRLL